LTARDRLLVDALRADPRYRMIADRLDPPPAVAKPTPKPKRGDPNDAAEPVA